VLGTRVGYDSEARTYYTSVFLEGKLRFFYDTNPLALAFNVVSSCFVIPIVVQGTMQPNKSEDPTAVLAKIKSPKFEMRSTRQVNMPSLPPIGGLDPFGGAIDEWFDSSGLNTGGYMSSWDVVDPELRLKSLYQLGEEYIEPGQVTDEEVDFIYLGFLMLCATEEDRWEMKPKLTEWHLNTAPVENSAAGAIPLLPNGGPLTGSKRQFHTAASKAAVSSVQAINYVASAKAEVIKRGKKVRQIVVEPFPVYLENWWLFEHLVKKKGRVVDGDARGLSRAEGGHNGVLFAMYYDEKRFNEDLDFAGFVDGLMVCEDDKKNWEATTNRVSGMAAMLFLCTQVGFVEEDIEHAARAIAHFMGPIIKLTGHTCYYCPYKVASGSYMTLYLNNLRHKVGYQVLSAVLQTHVRCGCYLCGLGISSDDHALSRIVGGVYMGDDRLRVSQNDQEVCAAVDYILGSVTIHETLPLKDAEFLRTRFKWDGCRLTTVRERERVFNKLYYGTARWNKENFCAALMSASLELGDDREGNEMLQGLYDALDWNGMEEESTVCSDSLYLGVMPGDYGRPFGYETVVARQFGGAKKKIAIEREWDSSV